MKDRTRTHIDAFLPISPRRDRCAEHPSLRLGTHWSPPWRLHHLTCPHPALFTLSVKQGRQELLRSSNNASMIFHAQVVSPVEVCSELVLQSSFSLAHKIQVPLSFASTRVTLKQRVRYYSRAEISEPRSCEIQGFTNPLQQHYVQKRCEESIDSILVLYSIGRKIPEGALQPFTLVVLPMILSYRPENSF